MPNLLAPIAHHWLDATHITFGVVTAGVYGDRWKAEASAFNGRAPDEERTDFDLAPLDSVSGRVWFLPTTTLALQISAGGLTEAEPAEDSGARIDVTRVTASATYHRALQDAGIWATTVAWGRNAEGDHGTNALLVRRISRSPTGIRGLAVSNSSRRPDTISICTTLTARERSQSPSCKAATPAIWHRGRA
jgi:hypothetical protein